MVQTTWAHAIEPMRSLNALVERATGARQTDLAAAQAELRLIQKFVARRPEGQKTRDPQGMPAPGVARRS